MRRSSWASRLSLLLFSSAALVVVAAAPASAGDVTVHAGRVIEIPQPGTSMTAPADGRLRGRDYMAQVTGVAWPSAAGVGTRYTAAPGDRLVVFTLEVSQAPGAVAAVVFGNPPSTEVAATLQVGSQPYPVDLSDIDEAIRTSGTFVWSGTATYLAAVPSGTRHVSLTLTEGPTTQSLSLWTLRRLPPAPPILYRGDTSPVSAAPAVTTALPMTDPGDGDTYSATIVLDSATMGWFAPDPQESTPTSEADAILTVKLEADGPQQEANGFFDVSELPGDDLLFTPTGGQTVQGQVVPAAPQEVNGIGLLDGTYWFTVPEGITTGTLTINPGPVTGNDSADIGAGEVPLGITASASLSLSFPPPVVLAAQRTTPWATAPHRPTHSASAAPSSSGAGYTDTHAHLSGYLVLVLVLVALALGVAGAVMVSRRRGQREEAQGQVTEDGDGVPIDDDRAPDSQDTPPVVEERSSSPPVTPAVSASTGGLTAPLIATPTALGHPDDLVVRVLGPVEITGWRGEPPGGIAEELCCYLALHQSRPLTTDELIGALWPVELEADAKPKTVRNHASRLRGAVGSDRFPDAGTGGYRLDALTDWWQFTQWVAEAERSEPVVADALRSAALDLVRGEPFTGVPSGRYSWAFAESLASDMAVAVVGCAHRLSADRLAAGDTAGSEAAARTGLLASPREERLWLDAAAALKASGDEAGLARLIRDAERAAGPELARRLQAESYAD